ncbi:hypothetical protein CcCBS67573_g07841 [Chytriomyces confervae]|uniref:UBC core domain-containing protein n=1 Tax=Chytriomyces confervae TaxID=246404 RepID=A0A507ESX6_9FUNG|nr:hypothetical protein CcCBS67573_g07841 [Chytriomyces confervae]
MSQSVKAVMRGKLPIKHNSETAPQTSTRPAELVQLNAKPPAEGIRMIDTVDVLDIQAWMAGPEGTPYAGGCFKIRLVPGPQFPSSPPKGFFETKIFHPNVSPSTGEICVNTLKKDWSPSLGIAHILLTIRCLLIAPNPESALNNDAGRLLLDDYESYARHAKLFTSLHARIPAGIPNPFPGQSISLLPPSITNNLANAGFSNISKISSSRMTDGVAAVSLRGSMFGRAMETAQAASCAEDAVSESSGKRRAVDTGGNVTALPLFENASNDRERNSVGNESVMKGNSRKSLRRL